MSAKTALLEADSNIKMRDSRRGKCEKEALWAEERATQINMSRVRMINGTTMSFDSFNNQIISFLTAARVYASF